MILFKPAMTGFARLLWMGVGKSAQPIRRLANVLYNSGLLLLADFGGLPTICSNYYKFGKLISEKIHRRGGFDQSRLSIPTLVNPPHAPIDKANLILWGKLIMSSLKISETCLHFQYTGGFYDTCLRLAILINPPLHNLHRRASRNGKLARIEHLFYNHICGLLISYSI
jgi:hypothetical protein